MRHSAHLFVARGAGAPVRYQSMRFRKAFRIGFESVALFWMIALPSQAHEWRCKRIGDTPPKYVVVDSPTDGWAARDLAKVQLGDGKIDCIPMSDISGPRKKDPATGVSAQLSKKLAEYKEIQTISIDTCGVELDTALIQTDIARMKGTTAPDPSTVAADCIKEAETKVSARYFALAAQMPARERLDLLDIQAAWFAAIRAIPMNAREFPALRTKFDEAWKRWEATH